MAATSLNLNLTAALRRHVDEVTGENGLYATPSEYVRDLIRKDMEARGAAPPSPPPRPVLDVLRERKAEILALAEKYGARRLRVFGSVARREERPDSDVDFLVDFPPGYDMFKQRIPLMFALEELTGRKVDLVPEHEMNEIMRSYVLQDAVEL
jgi:predicted nucleotidyltransferase